MIEAELNHCAFHSGHVGQGEFTPQQSTKMAKDRECAVGGEGEQEMSLPEVAAALRQFREMYGIDRISDFDCAKGSDDPYFHYRSVSASGPWLSVWRDRVRDASLSTIECFSGVNVSARK